MSLMLSVCLALTTGCRPHACGFESLQITCGNPCPQPALVTSGCGVMYSDECSIVSNEVCGPVVEKAPVIIADTAESLSTEAGLGVGGGGLGGGFVDTGMPIGYSGRAWGYPGGGYGGGLGGGFGFGNGQGAPGRGFGIAGGGGGGRGGGSGNGSGNGTGSGDGTGTGTGTGTANGIQGQIQGVVVNITGPTINVSQTQTQTQQQQQQQQQGQGQFQNNNNNNGGHCGCRPPQNVPVPASAWFGVAGVVALVGIKRKRNAAK